MAKSFLNQSALPPGLRNNNPGNLRPGIDWQGAIGTAGGFLVFKDIAWGIRAMAIDIGNDIRLDGSNTIRKLITEYAPPSENPTDSYIANMVKYTGFGADQALPIQADTLLRLVRGIINVEVGPSYSHMITDADIQEGLQLMPGTLLDYFQIGSIGVDNPGIAIAVGVAAVVAVMVFSK